MKREPPIIDDTWYFRGKLMESCYPYLMENIDGIKFKTVQDAKQRNQLNLVFGVCQVQKMEPLGNMQLWDAL